MRMLSLVIKRYQNSLMAILLIGIIVLAVRLFPHAALSQSLTYSRTFYDSHHKLLRMTLTSDDKYRLWTPLEEMSADSINSLLLHEDQWFYYHPGINPISLMRAVWATYIGGGNRQGASTITMQLARMHWKINTKTIPGKLLQILRAFELELMYSKHDILEAYLNYAPFGRNIEGIGAASLIYFDKPASQINLLEAITLTVLPQSPTYRIDKQTGIAGPALVKASQQLFDRWQQSYPVKDNIAALFSQPLMMRQPEQLPFIAPHFINQLLQQYRLQDNEQSTITTLDTGLQKIIEQQIAIFLERNHNKGITNATALLVDTQTMGVKALIGSSNYFNVAIQGQVNGTFAKRSPGSTLKPFIYGLGIDQGIIHPMTILKDVKTDFGFYTPENFDQKFKGPISATQALIYSRNIPAVQIASKLENPSFYQFLKDANVKNLASQAHYGLALVLGGGEISSQELATLYAMLPNQGKWRPLKWIEDANPSDDVKALLSPEASFMVKEMLLQNTRKQDYLYKRQSHAIPIYWKTGTSWGFRDAWTAGGFKQYVLIVWLGNFDGSSNQAFVGVDAATPLFFNIIDAINASYPNTKEPKQLLPENIKQIDICLTSGNLVTKWCQAKGKSWFIPGVSPITVDTVYRPVEIDNETGQVACPPYVPNHTHTEIFEFWPSDLANVFARAAIPKKTPPSSAHCSSPQTIYGQPPQITSPLKNVIYQFQMNKKQIERMSLSATSDGEVRQLYWFVDTQFIGSSAQNESIEWLPTKSGSFKFLVVDDLGRSDTRKVKVEFLH